MKHIIKFVMAAFLLAAVSSTLFAQSSTNESAELNVSATVQGALSITKESDVNFGNISATTDGIVRLVPDGSSSSYVGSNSTTGKLTISGGSNATVLISYPGGITLQNDGETPVDLEYSLHVFGNKDDVPATAIQLSNEGIAGENVSRMLDGVTGNFFLYVGGALGGSVGAPAALSDQAAGEYTGTVTFEVKYN